MKKSGAFYPSGRAFWKLYVVVGWKPGTNWVIGRTPDVLYLGRKFERTETGALIPYLGGDCGSSGFPVFDPKTKESVLFDANYSLSLGDKVYPGNEKDYVSPAVFAAAMRSLGELIRPYAREGKLGSEHEPSTAVASLPPWQTFRGSEMNYWVSVYPQIAALFHVPPRLNNTCDHDEIARMSGR